MSRNWQDIFQKGQGLSNQAVDQLSGMEVDLATALAGSGSVLTTKGDLVGYASGAVRIPVGTNNQVLTADSAQSSGVKWSNVTTGPSLAPFSHSGAATVGAGVVRFPVPTAATISGVIATANTAPTGASLIFDVNKNGTTIFTTQANRPSIAAGSFATSAAAVPDVTSLVAGDYLTVDIDQIGSTVAGSDLVVVVYFA